MSECKDVAVFEERRDLYEEDSIVEDLELLEEGLNQCFGELRKQNNRLTTLQKLFQGLVSDTVSFLTSAKAQETTIELATKSEPNGSHCTCVSSYLEALATIIKRVESECG